MRISDWSSDVGSSDLRYAAGRPIVSQDAARSRAVAFATVSMLPGANMNFAIIAINLAKDWASLRQAFKLHVSPTNLHYADIDGNTGRSEARRVGKEG